MVLHNSRTGSLTFLFVVGEDRNWGSPELKGNLEVVQKGTGCKVV